MKLRNPYVLVVSADVERSSSLIQSLAGQGLSAFACHSAKEALCAPRPEVLVTDLDLEDHDGLELCEALSAGTRPMATVLMCTEASLDVYRRAMRLNVFDLCPIDGSEHELTQVIQSASETLQPDASATEFESSLPSTAPACEGVQRELAAWMLVRGIAPSTRCRVTTALGEALENACRHGYPVDVGPIEVQARLEGRELEVHIFDRGEGMDPEAQKTSGCFSGSGGLARMASLCEDHSFASHATLGTHVNLRFSVHRTQFSEDECTDYEDFDFLVPDHVRALLLDMQGPEQMEVVHLSPAIAVTVGRLLAGPHANPVFAAGI